MKNWLCFSSKDLFDWKEQGSPLKATDFAWAKGDAFASKVTARNGKFFWYEVIAVLPV